MVEVLIGVIVGYALSAIPSISFLEKRRKTESKAEPTEAERIRARRAIKEYNNFLAYDGTEQNDILD